MEQLADAANGNYSYIDTLDEPGFLRLPYMDRKQHDYDVFISYSRGDKAFVDRIVLDLRAAGVRVWFDPLISLGEDISEAIQRGIRESAVYAPVLSPNSMQSFWLPEEYALAADRGTTPVLPILLGTSPEAFEPFVQDPRTVGYDELHHQLGMLAGDFRTKLQDEHNARVLETIGTDYRNEKQARARRMRELLDTLSREAAGSDYIEIAEETYDTALSRLLDSLGRLARQDAGAFDTSVRHFPVSHRGDAMLRLPDAWGIIQRLGIPTQPGAGAVVADPSLELPGNTPDRPIRHLVARYTLDGETVHFDRVTSLEWRFELATRPVLDQASARALAEKPFADRRDWRLPTLEEALTLLAASPRASGACRYLDEAFAPPPLPKLWTADLHPEHNGGAMAWSVCLDRGDCLPMPAIHGQDASIGAVAVRLVPFESERFFKL